MAKRTRKIPLQTNAQEEKQQSAHMTCAHAYGYCYRAADGSPISCRCDIHGEYLKVCRDPACADYIPRYGAIPSDIPVGPSENLHPEQLPVKVVPIFGTDRKVPVAVLPASDLPHNAFMAEYAEKLERDLKLSPATPFKLALRRIIGDDKKSEASQEVTKSVRRGGPSLC